MNNVLESVLMDMDLIKLILIFVKTVQFDNLIVLNANLEKKTEFRCVLDVETRGIYEQNMMITKYL